MATSDSLHPHQTGVKIRNTTKEDIPKIVNLQKESFPYLARYGNVWHPDELQSHLHVFPEGQFVAVEPDGTVVGSASTLVVSLSPEYAEHTWKDITADGKFTNHDPSFEVLQDQSRREGRRKDYRAIGLKLTFWLQKMWKEEEL